MSGGALLTEMEILGTHTKQKGSKGGSKAASIRTWHSLTSLSFFCMQLEVSTDLASVSHMALTQTLQPS